MTAPTISLYELADTAGIARALRRLRSDKTAVVAARPTTRTDKDRALVEDLLRNIGASPDVSGNSSQAHWHDHLMWWWHGHAINELVAVDMQLLGATQLQLLIDLATISGCDLTLVATAPIDDALRDQLNLWPVRDGAADALLSRLDNTPTGHTPDTHDTPVRVPDCDWPAFAAETERLLPTHQAAQVLGWMRAAATHLAGTVDDVDEESIGKWLRQRAVDAAHVDQLVAEIRAAQTWLFLRGWHLQVDLTGMLARLTDPPTSPLHADDTWTRLAAYRQPERHVTCLLAAHGLAFDQMRELTVAHVADDGATINHAGRALRVPDAARPAVRALLLAHAHDGNPDAAPLLLQQDGRPTADATLARYLSDPIVEVGVAVVSGRTTRRAIEPGNWMRRHGLNLTPIGPAHGT